MEKNKPVHKGKLGRIRFSVWENETRNGKLYSVSIDRVYMRTDDVTGTQEFRNVSTFNRDDLELVKLAADKAQTFIDQQTR